jgi:hypothetical protein
MNSWLLHAIFAGILVTSVVANERSGDVLSETDNLEPAVIRAAQSHGLVLLRPPTAKEPAGILIFDAPACARPVVISLLSVTLDDEPLVRGVGEPGDVVRYIYLDRSWTVLPNPLAVFFEWKKHKALELFGLTSYVPSAYMLRLAWHPGCDVADAIDWQVVWRRDFLMQPGPD